MADIDFKSIDIQTRNGIVTGKAAFTFAGLNMMFWESYVGKSEAECLTALNNRIREKAKQVDELNKP